MELEVKNTEMNGTEQIEKASLIADLCKLSCIMPATLVESRLWKKTPSSSKEVYLILAANYDYQSGLSKVTHTMIQDASGIGSRATLVKALNVLKESRLIHVVEIGTKNKIVSHNYLMPYQEEVYAKMLGSKPRDFSHYNPVIFTKKPSRKKKSIYDDIDPLFFKACHKLSCLGVDTPNKLLERYSEDTQSLRTIIFMCDCAYVIKERSLIVSDDPYSMLVEFISNAHIDKNAFGDEITKEVRAILIKNKEK